MHTSRRYYTWFQVFFIAAMLASSCQPIVQPAAVTQERPSEVSALKLLVDQTGLFRLTSNDLENAGLLVNSPSRLRLTRGDEQVPFWLEESGEGFNIIFYGVKSESLYANQNIYWIRLDDQVNGDPLLMDTQISNELPAAVREDYYSTVVLEEKRVFSPLILDDPWYWFALTAPDEQSIEMDLGDVSPGMTKLSFSLWGATQAPSSYDHHLRVHVNGGVVHDEWWDGSGSHQFEIDIPDGSLQPGENLILLQSPGDTGAIADTVFLQRLALTYQRSDPAENDRLSLIGDGNAVVLKGFEGPVTVLDVTQPDQPVRLIDLETSEQEVMFIAEIGKHYLAIGQSGYGVPQINIPVEIPAEMQSTRGATYLAIGPAALLEPLAPLMELRKQQGITSIVLPVEAVYDHFNAGLPEPDAIRKFVRHAAANWQIKPQYLLLVGDSTYDPRGYLGELKTTQLPLYFINTQFGGLTGTDLPYVDVNGDDKPDLAVGRVPASTPEDVMTWVKKTLAYEDALNARILFKALAVADGQETSFRYDAQEFLDHLAGGYQGDLYAPVFGVEDATETMTGYFDSDYHLIGYFGHGSLNMWARDRLLTIETVQDLNHTNLPIVLTMTCLNGFFFHPTTPSLAEALLFSPDGGASAVLAPTSLTMVLDQKSLGSNLYRMLADPGEKRLGDVLLAAQQQMLQDTQGQRDVLLTFLLFGDPALRLR